MVEISLSMRPLGVARRLSALQALSGRGPAPPPRATYHESGRSVPTFALAGVATTRRPGRDRGNTPAERPRVSGFAPASIRMVTTVPTRV